MSILVGYPCGHMRALISPRIFLVLTLASLLAGCATTPAPVVDRSLGGETPPPSSVTRAQPRAAEHANGETTSQGYVVARGDTLYSIAFKHGMDYRALAERNGIGPPYTIHPGQVLHLGEGSASAPRTGAPPSTSMRIASAPEKTAPVFEPVENNPPAATAAQTSGNEQSGAVNLPQVNLQPGATTQEPATVARPGATPPRTGEVVAVPAPESSAANAPNIANPQPLPPAAAGRTRTVDGVTWQWPSDGAVISSSGSGLDIAGNAGDPVRAAADGTVVYSGNGLIGYGELIIIKHSDNYLSAYGHNRKRLVQEGQRVRAGQQIAEMGSSGAPREELHFEIRKAGKPVDPTDYLPGR